MSKLTNLGQGRFKCNDCGDINVRWEQTKAGKWFVAQIGTKGRWNGLTVGPHFPKCQETQKRDADWKAHEAKQAAEKAQSERILAIMADMSAAGATMEEIAAAITAEKESN